MHECPMGPPLADTQAFNPVWGRAIECYSPWLTVSGHTHEAPLFSRRWHARLARTQCVNVGQSEAELHYAVLDFEFNGAKPSLPLILLLKTPHKMRRL